MHVIVHISKFFDWVPVPAGVTVTDADIKAEKVRPAANGGWSMKVTKQPKDGTFTTVHLPEEQVIAKIIHEKCRPEGGRTFTRPQAMAYYLAENIMPQNAHRRWIKKAEVHDDGPDETMLRAMLAPHTVSEASRVDACKEKGAHAYVKDADNTTIPTRCLECGHVEGGEPSTVPNIDLSEIEDHVAAYMKPASAKDLEDHLHKHFKVKAVS